MTAAANDAERLRGLVRSTQLKLGLRHWQFTARCAFEGGWAFWLTRPSFPPPRFPSNNIPNPSLMRVMSRAQRREAKTRAWLRSRLVRSNVVAAAARGARSQQDWLARAFRRWLRGTREEAQSIATLAGVMERGRLRSQQHHYLLGRGWRAICRSAEINAHAEQAQSRWLAMVKVRGGGG